MAKFLIGSLKKITKIPHTISHIDLLPKSTGHTFSIHLLTEAPKSLCEL